MSCKDFFERVNIEMEKIKHVIWRKLLSICSSICSSRSLSIKPIINSQRNLFVVSIDYHASIEQIDKLLSEHVKFLKDFYANRTFIASGRKVPRTGGVIIASAESKKVLESIIEKDPFYKAQLAKYEVTEFVPSMVCQELLEVIKKESASK